jgi:isochorismate hydrolase
LPAEPISGARRFIAISGIATNFGMESSARNAYEFGYHQVFKEDVMGIFSKADREFSIQNVSLRSGLTRSAKQGRPALGDRK